MAEPRTTGSGGSRTGGSGRSGASARVTQLGRYRIEKTLGVGGSATVYLATDTTIDRQVALKVLHEHLRDDPVTIRRFANDARALARLKHPNIAQVFAAELDQYYFAMEFIEGVDLSKLIATHGSLPPARALAIAVQVADALAVIHRAGLIHRDVKPGNILIQPGDQVKLTDFSVAQENDETVLTLAGSLVGTVEYMAPEQIREQEADGRADVYALGAVLYEMLVGRPPFARDAGQSDLWPLMERILSATAQSPSEIDAGIPPEISAVVLHALAKDPATRYQTMDSFAATLRQFLGWSATVAVSPVALAEPSLVDHKVRLTWTATDAAEFERYEILESGVRDFAGNAVRIAATIRAREETHADLAPAAAGARFFRVRTHLTNGLSAVSNRVSLDPGRRPPFWRRRVPATIAIGGALLFAAVLLYLRSDAKRPNPSALGPAAPAAETPAPTGEITIWGFEGTAAGLEAVARDFNALPGNGVRATVRSLLWGTGHDQLDSAARGRALPDVVQLGTTWIPEFALRGALLPLDSFYQTSAVIKQAEFYDASRKLVTSMKDGRTYTVPLVAEPRLLAYNRTLLEKAGYSSPPARWEDVEKIHQALKARPGVQTLTMPRADVLFFLPFLWQSGTDIYDWIGKRFTFVDIEIAEATAAYHRLYANGAVIDQALGAELVAFRSGKVAMMMTGPWVLNEFNHANDTIARFYRANVALALTPGVKFNTSFLGGSHLAIADNSPNPGAAWAFIEYTLRPEVQLKMLTVAGNLPARQDAWSRLGQTPDTNVRVFMEQMRVASSTPPVAYWDAVLKRMEIYLKTSGTNVEENLRLLEELDRDVAAMAPDTP